MTDDSWFYLLYPAQHGGGQVFKNLQGLIQTLETGGISMAVLVAEEESCASRHLRYCAMEQNIHVTVSYCCHNSHAAVNSHLTRKIENQ